MLEQLTVELPRELIEEIRALAGRERRTVDGQFQWLIERGIEATDSRPKRLPRVAVPGQEAEANRISEARAQASRDLIGRLLELYAEAGMPSTRKVAAKAGGISHTTVHVVLRGGQIPKLDNLLKIVAALGGDQEYFRSLWIRACG
jgi:DNA-binding phage protein